jgi:hypothetical protein
MMQLYSSKNGCLNDRTTCTIASDMNCVRRSLLRSQSFLILTGQRLRVLERRTRCAGEAIDPEVSIAVRDSGDLENMVLVMAK